MDAKIAPVHIHRMLRIACIAVLVAAVPACKKHVDDTPYAHDVAKICNMMELSGAAKARVPQQALMTAQWLSANLETSEAHEFLVRVQPLDGEERAAAYEAEAKRVGLTSCALADEWRK